MSISSLDVRVILSVNLLGDTMNAVIGHDGHTLIDLLIGGAIIVYLVSKAKRF